MAQITDTVQIGSMTVANRIAVPPMVCFHWTDDTGYVTSKNLRHYEDLAAGGAGLIIGEATAVLKRGRLHGTEMGLWEDGQIDGWRQMSETVHRHGAKFIVQLVHAGISGIDPEADCPSDCDVHAGEGIHGHEMSIQRIHEVEDAFVAAALRAKTAGLDGVELHGCHGYLLCQFMNRRINRRQDAYGQDETLMAREILQAVREACGPDFVVGIRMGAFEPTLADGVRHAEALAPYADFLDVSYGFGGESTPEKPDGFPCSAAIYGAKVIKEHLPDMPVFGVDSVNSRADVEAALAQGLDMVDVGRGSLVNPHFARDVMADRLCGRCLHCRPACHWSPSMNDGEVHCPGAVLFAKACEK